MQFANDKTDLKANIDYRLTERNEMRRVFLSGILCGVMMAAAVTFALAIPANNDHWRVEIVNRGGGTWYLDTEGNIGWMWTVQPISQPAHPATIITPRSRPKPDSSRERL